MSRPNILILYVDQHRWDALGANGNPHIKTPNLDALAQEGVSFTQCFSQNPLCMPSRVSFLTGRYPSDLGITYMGVDVPPDTATIADVLGQYGYYSANIGKLHFQTHADRNHAEMRPMYGFDEMEISDEPGVYEDAYRAWVRQIAPEQLDHLSVGLPPARAEWLKIMGVEDEVVHPSNEPRDDFIGTIPFRGDDAYTHTAFVAERTCQFIRRQTAQQPFLCVAGFYSPHAPLVVPQRFLDLYDRDTLPLPIISAEKKSELGWTDAYLREAVHGYYAMVSEVDHHVGRIVQELEQSGALENTIILFTSDHGEWLGDGGRFGKGYPGDDGSTRVPLIVRLPQNQRAKGLVIDGIVESLDVLPTLLDAVAIQPPPHIQGQSFYAHLVGENFAGRDSALTEFAGWKSLRTQTHRYLIDKDGAERLWRIEDDLEVEEFADFDAVGTLRHKLLMRILQNERPHKRLWLY